MPRHLTTNDTASFVTTTQVGAVSGVAALGADGKVPSAQLPLTSTGSVTSVNGQIGNVALNAANVNAVATTEKGTANGVAQLDSTTRLVVGQLPTTVLTTAQVGVASGLATLDATGKLPAAQLNAPVTSVNGLAGAVSLTAANVNALATSTRGATNGVASLDANKLVPQAQIPSLVALYQQAPGSTATKPGQQLTSVAAGSNSTVWVDPMVYVVGNFGSLPLNPPNGSLCVRTGANILFLYSGGSWVALPYEEPWRTLTFPTTTVRGYGNNNPSWIPQIRRMGSLVQIRGRMELVSGANFTSGVEVVTLPDDCVPSQGIDLVGTSTTGANQPGIARFQISPSSNVLTFFCGSGPNPATPWVGLSATYSVD